MRATLRAGWLTAAAIGCGSADVAMPEGPDDPAAMGSTTGGDDTGPRPDASDDASPGRGDGGTSGPSEGGASGADPTTTGPGVDVDDDAGSSTDGSEDPDTTTGSTTTGEPAPMSPPCTLTDFSPPHEVVLGSWGPGSAWADFNGDEWLDLVTTGGHAPSHVYLNQGDGTFAQWSGDTALAELAGVVSVAVADYDNDGDPDIYAVRFGENILLRNDGPAGLGYAEDALVDDNYHGTSGSWGDYDGDGWLDLYVTNAEEEPDILYHADGDGGFSDVTHLVAPPADYQSYASIWLDYDNDDDADLYVSNDKKVGNRLWRNDGPGCGGWCFTNVATAQGAALDEWSMGVHAADYDNDLDLDIVFTDIGDVDLIRNGFGEGIGEFEHVSAAAGLGELGIGWGVLFVDSDNDGWLDLYVGEGTSTPDWANQLYRNQGDGTFVDVSEGSGCSDPGSTFGVTAADYDEDGALDFVVSNRDTNHHVFRGSAPPEHHWLTVDLHGGGTVNRDAIGARVELVTDGGRTMMREVRTSGSVAATLPRRLHFGLGTEGIAAVTVRWPDGLVETPSVPPVDQRWVHHHPDAE